MIGILIVSHGAFGESLIHSASHVLGKRPLFLRQLGVTVKLGVPPRVTAQARTVKSAIDALSRQSQPRLELRRAAVNAVGVTRMDSTR